MSSVVRSKISGQALPKPNNVVTPTYDVGGNDIAVPFTFNKQGGVLDFDFSGNFSASTTINSGNPIYVQGSTFTALRMVNSLGPNFIAWCENGADHLDDEAADAGSVVLYSRPVVVRANQLEISLDPDTNIDAFGAGFTQPINFELAAGSPTTSDYYTTYLFRTPLVIQYKVGGVTKYAAFNTQFEGNT
jgi:hypothetical protein